MKQPLMSSRLPRSSGVLLHVTSLPGPHGIGDLGPAAHQWVDALGKAEQRWWQILPLGPGGQGYSPYSSFSATAGNPLLISPDALVRDRLLSRQEAQPPPTLGRSARVDYPAVERHKSALLQLAWERFRRRPPRALSAAYRRFRAAHRHWLDGFALFMALRDRHAAPSWTDWPKPLVERRPDAVRAARRQLRDPIDQLSFAQFLFFRQWAALRRRARAAGVKIIGDVPIFVAQESADVWTNPRLFLLDRNQRPRVVAGVPPDYFSRTGQRWGNPMYNWPAMARDGFDWWVRRFAGLLEQVDLVRIDHFRGFAACWQIPATARDARTGRWVASPGSQLFQKLGRALGALPFIAEDLGLITPDVLQLRDRFGLPGMRVLQFGFGDDPKNPFLPHNYIQNSIAYTGTHDNDTTVGWYASLPAKQRKAVLRYAPDAAADPAWALIRLAWSSVADVAIAPLQDLLGLGSNARMNSPGTTDQNWSWRLEDFNATRKALTRLNDLSQQYARATLA